jgi:serine protease
MRLPGTITGALLVAAVVAAAVATPALADDGVAVAGPPSAPYAADEVLVQYSGEPGVSRVDVPAGETVPQAVDRLNADPSVVAARPDFVATGSALPNDPGMKGVKGGWASDQWNFVSLTAGINVLGAWANFGNLGVKPGAGVTVAVLDSGVAYRSKGAHFAPSPDLAKSTFVKGKDFVDGDSAPLDENGHGTHVASTIAEETNNKVGETGIAYGAKIMPVRVLDRNNSGRASDIAAGIKWAAKHGADVINLSLDFGSAVKHCGQVPMVCRAIRFAAKRNVVVVAAAGNDGASTPDMPARAPQTTISVSASTDAGCIASTSNTGAMITAPGGGKCSGGGSGKPIYQYSMDRGAATHGNYKKFDFVGLSGTSQAAAETSAAAALVVSSGVSGASPSPAAVAKRLTDCARPAASSFGAGILDVGRATSSSVC